MSEQTQRWPPVVAPPDGGADLVGVILDGQYQLLQELGRGGMGIVYLAKDLRLKRRVAIKLLSPAVCDDDSLARFEREAIALAALRHPNVVAIHAMNMAGPDRYLVMDYIAGETFDGLRKGLAERGERMPVARALELIRGVAAGLSAAHDAGLVHRDVSGANVIIAADDGRPVLTDFGLARVVAGPAANLTLAGTPRYLAPEVLRADRIPADRVHLVDLYALAILAYEALTGQPPFEAPELVELLRQHRDEAPPPPSQIRPELPAAIDRVLLDALAKDPLLRPSSCAAFAAALTACRDVTLRDRLPRPAAHRTVVLLVTPDDDWVRAFETHAARGLGDLRVAIEHAADGETAWRMIQERPPSLVICAIDVVGLNVVELLATLRGCDATEHVPIAVVAPRPLSPTNRMVFDRLGVKRILPPRPPDERSMLAIRDLLTPGTVLTS